MKILLIGATGTIGKHLTTTFSSRGHEVITAGRTTGTIQVDISSPESINNLYTSIGNIDACICTAGTGYYGPFDTMTSAQMLPGIQGKLLGQVNLVHLPSPPASPQSIPPATAPVSQ
jgi:short-subunit dehydrogenase